MLNTVVLFNVLFAAVCRYNFLSNIDSIDAVFVTLCMSAYPMAKSSSYLPYSLASDNTAFNLL